MRTPDSESISALEKAMDKLKTDEAAHQERNSNDERSSSTPPSAMRANKDRDAVTSPSVDSFSYQLEEGDESVSTRTRSAFTDKTQKIKSKYVEWDDEFLHRPG